MDLIYYYCLLIIELGLPSILIGKPIDSVAVPATLTGLLRFWVGVPS